MSRSKSASNKKQISEFTLRITVVFNYTFAYINICSAAFSVEKEQLQHFAAKKKSVFFQAEAERLSWSVSFKTSKAIYGGFLKELLSSWVKSRLKVTALKGLELWAQVVLVFEKSYYLRRWLKYSHRGSKCHFLTLMMGHFKGKESPLTSRLYPIWSGLGRQESSSGDATLLWPLDCKHLRFPSGHIMEAGLPTLSYDRYLIKHTTSNSERFFTPYKGTGLLCLTCTWERKWDLKKVRLW